MTPAVTPSTDGSGVVALQTSLEEQGGRHRRFGCVEVKLRAAGPEPLKL